MLIVELGLRVARDALVRYLGYQVHVVLATGAKLRGGIWTIGRSWRGHRVPIGVDVLHQALSRCVGCQATHDVLA